MQEVRLDSLSDYILEYVSSGRGRKNTGYVVLSRDLTEKDSMGSMIECLSDSGAFQVDLYDDDRLIRWKCAPNSLSFWAGELNDTNTIILMISLDHKEDRFKIYINFNNRKDKIDRIDVFDFLGQKILAKDNIDEKMRFINRKIKSIK